MKKFAFIPLALCVLLAVTGCDFMRKLGGRPTSEDIEKARVEKLLA